MKISYTKPSINEDDVEFVLDAAKNGWGSNCYGYIEEFEKNFAEHLNVSHSIATSSCTGAIQLGIKALGLERGDEVIMADTNWIATVSPFFHMGIKPIFVDINPLTWCIDESKIEKKITSKTKAIVATHLYGNMCEMDSLQNIAKKNGLFLIEDSAEAIGSSYHGKIAGSIGDFGCFSFHGTKTLTTGEGGMFVTKDQDLYEKALTLSNHGRSRKQVKQFWADEVGFKFKMSNIQAALGCSQLKRINELVEKKQFILNEYKKRFLSHTAISMNPEIEGITNGAWMPTIVISDKKKIDIYKIIEKLNFKGIDARVFFYPLSSLSMFESNKKNLNSYSISKRALNLPSYHDMTISEIDFVYNNTIEILEESLLID